MSQSVLKPFSKQLNGLIISICALLTLLVLASFWMINFKAQQIDHLEKNQLPHISQLQNQQAELQALVFDIEKMKALSSAEQLPKQHVDITERLIPLKKAELYSAVAASRFFSDDKVLANLERVAKTSALNLKLKSQAQAQLLTAIKSLDMIIAEVESNSPQVSFSVNVAVSIKAIIKRATNRAFIIVNSYH